MKQGNYIRWNKNLCHIPLARDAHFRPEWHFSKKYNRWWCDLPSPNEEPEVRFRLPKETPKAERRIPTPFDMNVLFLLLMRARMREADSDWFMSRTEMLELLKVSISTANRTKLDAALALWTRLSILREQWYWGKDVRKHRMLPPPITTLRHDAKGIFVELHPDWLGPPARKRGYFVTLPFPLPMTAPEQNLIMMTAPWRMRNAGKPWEDDAGFDYKKLRTWNVRDLGLRIGLAHDQVAYVLRKRVIPSVQDWWQTNADDTCGLGWTKGARHIDFRGLYRPGR